MTLVHSFIAGNLLVTLLLLIGMMFRIEPPPIWAFVIGWPVVIGAIAIATNQ